MRHYQFRTLEEVEALLPTIAAYFPNPKTAAYGLQELMINAIEHGNLGISYDEKTRLLQNNIWYHEVMRRLALPAYRHLYVELSIEENDEEVRVNIRDQGQGFDWQTYIKDDIVCSARPNGRGIYTAMKLSFDVLDYKGVGNEVVGIVRR